MPGWIHSFLKQWWIHLTAYLLEQFEDELKRLGLYEAVRATCYGIEVSIPNFYSIFELYCPSIGTFFTPIGELGLALHEIWEVSKTPYRLSPVRGVFPMQ